MCRIIRAAKTPREKGVGVALLDISLHRYVQAHSSRSLTPGKLRRSVPLIATPKNLTCASVPFASQRRPGVLASWRLGGQSLSLRRLIAPGTTPCCEVRCWGGGAPSSNSAWGWAQLGFERDQWVPSVQVTWSTCATAREAVLTWWRRRLREWVWLGARSVTLSSLKAT